MERTCAKISAFLVKALVLLPSRTIFPSVTKRQRRRIRCLCDLPGLSRRFFERVVAQVFEDSGVVRGCREHYVAFSEAQRSDANSQLPSGF